MTARAVDVHALPAMLTALRLPSFHRHWTSLAQCADTEGWPAARFLAALAEVELAERETRRIQRHLAESRLPGGKTLATFDFKALPAVPRARIEALAVGDWVETGANLIAIGNSGAGKTHLLCAVGHALVETGRRVSYTRTTDLVQRLQAARRDLALEAALNKLDRFDLIILDDIGYAQKDRAGTSVLFELIARRYETRSLAIAANQPFSAWDRIFPDKAVTVAAIDSVRAFLRTGGSHALTPPRDHPRDERRQLPPPRRRRAHYTRDRGRSDNHRQPRRQPRSIRQRQPCRQNQGGHHHLNTPPQSSEPANLAVASGHRG